MMRTWQKWTRPSFVLAAACLLLHALANGHYGYFRDELYFIVCGDHPDWGYVDQAAIVPLLASWSHAVFGDSLWGFRLLPALVLTTCVAMTAEFALLIGGGRFAQWLAGACVLLGPIFLIQGVLFSTDLFQSLTWLALGWVLVRLEQTGNERWWLAFGVIAGFSLNAKYLMAFYLAALALGMMATPQRKSPSRPWIYLGALLGAVMVAPNILWQHAHGWPFLELGKAASGGKNIEMSPAEFFIQQIMITGPVATFIWLTGLWAGAVRPTYTVYRAFPIAWLVLFVVFDAIHRKSYCVSAVYPTLLALGAVRIELWLRNASARCLLLAGTVAAGATVTPLTLPILRIDAFLRYQQAVASRRHRASIRRKVCCHNTMPTCSAGRLWPARSPPCIGPYPRRTGHAPCSTARTTAKPPPSMYSAAAWVSRPPSAAITITFCGGRATMTAAS